MIHSDRMSIFLSCSFRAEDSAINDLVRGVCTALGMECVNVSAGYRSIPPEQARAYIAKSAGLIAIATQRDRLDNGDYAMPAAVREEISIAFGMGKHLLILGEEGVRFDGFMNNYGTRLPFERKNLSAPQFIEKLVFSLYSFKQELADATDLSKVQYASEYSCEVTRSLTTLEFDAGNPVWIQSITKRLRFEAPLQREIPTLAWPSVPVHVNPQAKPGEWDVRVKEGSRNFQIHPTVRMLTADRLELSLRIQPDPQPGDFIEFTRTFRSRYINPVSLADLRDPAAPALVIDGREYFAFDGIVTVERTQKLHIHFSFPAAYGISRDDVAIFVASHSFGIDYLAQWELKRLSSEVESFGSHIIADIRVENPLPRHIYGLAWVLPTGV